ncbi:MAG: peptidyl-prolyl cis-trans isomerase [Deltaproteobacteria bacterium]|nr:peptidyl-prolyl cis-trans isomerase [Deltaproteobacteria bacterium]
MPSRSLPFRVLCLGSLCVAVGCGGRGEKAPESSKSAAQEKDPLRKQVVATVGASTITAGEMIDLLNTQNPYMRVRFTSPERKKEFLKNLIRVELLVQEAKRRKLEQDPEVLRRVKRALVERLMEQLPGELVKYQDVTEADVKAFYEKNRTLFQQPAMVRASQLVVATEAEAQRLVATAKSKPGDLRFFTELVAKHSLDTASKARGGDLEFFTADDKKLPPALVKAVFALEGLWRVGGPIKVPGGFAVVVKTGSRPPVDRSLVGEAGQIRNRLFEERRIKAVEGFVEQLHTKAKIEINEELLKKVEPELKGGPLPPHGHPH